MVRDMLIFFRFDAVVQVEAKEDRGEVIQFITLLPEKKPYGYQKS
ncbi:hypothetical protein [Aquimarina sediminis]|nr:hypothetical protein [Aquimarina sediminis]